MPFEDYTPQDFVENEFFCQWVLHPTEDTSAFWEMFLSLHPEKYQDILKAKALILAIKETPAIVPDEVQIEQMWQNVVIRTIAKSEKEDFESDSISRSLWRTYLGWVAASLVIVVGGVWLYNKPILFHSNTITYQHLIEYQPEKLSETRNISSDSLQISLPDGSSVILTKGSRLSYPPSFGNIRKVYLEGEGFFEVKRDTARPFVVYAGQVITKVVGTSFWVKAHDEKSDIEVDVRTGCVAVAVANFVNEPLSEIKPQFLLSANQRASYSQLDKRLERSLVNNPLPVIRPKIVSEIVYMDKPVVELFEELEKTYNVDLVFDAETLKNCRINTSFSNETFFERLEIICRVLNTNYQIVETQIIVKSKECS
ncbi:FecR family protein [Xanthocytophaga flava]|uniref:FecR family protein n=1 Tax=Xanthocytophaga flava TaxID=3048013 RepID=UPI0028D6A112|nr:FecR domain-containing protein [Xanthocytophaga flavus]MDJ1467241.1 FecR domain-containing protein [Xanthocytophaga flavus]